ncbi:uncharacterized protein B0I36DRAFT_353805 [Microdochium trichocladiopsis]|uniref:2EXR domain-containing protein n=1 Tax=Microdochium trichocladiopsis TaxID=1682393 RepID=A0A9P9BKE0_9PEZI|nr:uncharacterized protein B0I36DRAFT_353805 [Microdochium trichocladiopsis]KAH7021101.1 hypothetical protein B0I36DRAFT_353805 [Microdochium trichocladiopsis]
MATFTNFVQLPCEIRVCIWSFTVIPRLVPLIVRSRCYTVSLTDAEQKEPRDFVGYDWRDWLQIKHVKSKTPVPAILHVSREARAVGSRLYEKTHDTIHEYLPVEQQYYTWVNWAIDIIAIDEGGLHDFLNFRHKIQRFRIVADNSDEYFNRSMSPRLSHYKNLRQAFIVCENGISQWSDVLDEYNLWCNREEVYLIEPDPDYIKTEKTDDWDWPDYWDRTLVGPRRMVRAVDAAVYYERRRRETRPAADAAAVTAFNSGVDPWAYPFTGDEPTLEMVLAMPTPPDNKCAAEERVSLEIPEYLRRENRRSAA